MSDSVSLLVVIRFYSVMIIRVMGTVTVSLSSKRNCSEHLQSPGGEETSGRLAVISNPVNVTSQVHIMTLHYTLLHTMAT